MEVSIGNTARVTLDGELNGYYTKPLTQKIVSSNFSMSLVARGGTALMIQ